MNIYGKEGKLLVLGRQGENEVTSIRFPVRKWIDTYGNGSFLLINQRSADEQAYPCVTYLDGDDLVWEIENSDLQYVGYGKAQLSLTVENRIAKSEIFDTFVLNSLDPTDTPPEPWKAWVDEIGEWMEQIDEAQSHYPQISTVNYHWLVYNVRTGEWDDTGVSARGSGSTVSDYDLLINKPKINGRVLDGDKTYYELGIIPESTAENNGKILKIVNGAWAIAEDAKLSINETENIYGGNTLTIGG